MMNKWVLILAISIGLVNVLLNITVSRHVNSTLKENKIDLVSSGEKSDIVASSETGQHSLSLRDFFRNVLKSIWTRGFLWVFLIGCLSLLGLTAFYSTGTPPQQGIILMGGASIVGGTIFAMFFYKKSLDCQGWILLVLITLWFISRWFNIVKSS